MCGTLFADVFQPPYSLLFKGKEPNADTWQIMCRTLLPDARTRPQKSIINFFISEQFGDGNQRLFQQQADRADHDNRDDDVRHVQVVPFIP